MDTNSLTNKTDEKKKSLFVKDGSGNVDWAPGLNDSIYSPIHRLYSEAPFIVFGVLVILFYLCIFYTGSSDDVNKLFKKKDL